MQAVILAAGKGTRLMPLTEDRPKQMVLVNGKPILEHILEGLPKKITEVIIVVGTMGEQIQEHFGDNWNGVPIQYTVQETLSGPATALRTAEHLLKDSFLVLTGDDLYLDDSLEALTHHQVSALVATVPNPESFGVVVLNEDGSLKEMIEKPENPPSNLVSTGAFVLNTNIFKYTAAAGPKDEYYIPDLVNQLNAKQPFAVEKTDSWLTISFPEDVAKAEAALGERKT